MLKNTGSLGQEGTDLKLQDAVHWEHREEPQVAAVSRPLQARQHMAYDDPECTHKLQEHKHILTNY